MKISEERLWGLTMMAGTMAIVGAEIEISILGWIAAASFFMFGIGLLSGWIKVE